MARQRTPAEWEHTDAEGDQPEWARAHVTHVNRSEFRWRVFLPQLRPDGVKQFEPSRPETRGREMDRVPGDASSSRYPTAAGSAVRNSITGPVLSCRVDG